MQRREAMMKSVSPVSLSLADPIVVDANINELERRIRELTDRVKALEEAGKANKPVDFATMYVPEDRVKERIADARCEERQRAADMVLDHYGDSVAKKHFESLAQFILDGPDAETQEHRPTATEAILGVQDHLRYTQADLDAAVEKDRERVDAWIRKTLEPGFMVWAEAKNGLLRHILNGDEVPE
jgi:hypothetical protein